MRALLFAFAMIPFPQPSVTSNAPTLAVLDSLPTASAPANRIDLDKVITEQNVGLFGLPFAPEGLTAKEKVDFYRSQAGLPVIFVGIAYREARYQNTARNYCCFGLWQLYFKNHMNDAQGREIYAYCKVDQPTDYWGDNPLAYQKQACVTYKLWKLRGLAPWKQTT